MKKYLKILFLLIVFIIIIGFGFYGINETYYTSSQINLFLKINSLLSAGGEVWLNITALGDALLLFPLFSFLIFTNTRAWAALFGAIPLSAVLSHIGKAFFAMPRPAAIIDHHEFTIIGKVLSGTTSLPSGHTITIFSLVFAILYIFYNNNRIKHLTIWSAGLISLGLIVALSRVAVGAHWPLDIVLDAIFGFFGGVSGGVLTFKYNTWWHWMTIPKYRYIHISILLILSFTMIMKYSQLTVAWISLIVVILVIFKLLRSGNAQNY